MTAPQLELSSWRGARWSTPEIDHQSAELLSNQCKIEPAVARLLLSRGILTFQQANAYLNPSWTSLHDPLSMQGMSKAVARIQKAITDKEAILVYGDYDVDGTSSVVILTKALEALGTNPRFHIPHRIKDGYGMQPAVIEAAAASGIKLVISVDTGIRAHEVVESAKQHGVDIIITDHHLPEDQLPDAVAVLNPNAPGCQYPEKELCGAGVTFKLIQALFAASAWPQSKQHRYLESFLKIVALATIADVVPLRGENRAIVKLGLDGYHTINNLGLKALLKVAGIAEGTIPNAGQVGFRIAPRINASGRMADAQSVIELFLTTDPVRAEELANLLNERNEERQQAEKKILQEVLDQCEQQQLAQHHAALVFAGQGWHRGVVGIVASRIVERYHRPTFILGVEESFAQGSGRSIRAFDLHHALESMRDLFTKFGGHKYAAGLTLPPDKIEEFRTRLDAHARQMLSPEDLFPLIEIDAELALSELTDRTVQSIFSMAPFGSGNPAPVFLIRDAVVAAPPTIFAEKHLRISFRQGAKTITAKAWDQAPRAEQLPVGTKIDLVLSVEEDTYSRDRGYSFWSATIRDLRLQSATSALAAT